uniref:Uncharacterized protein n=1 Tax=Oryza punctata TaxID=4537 RepID=A0A0E0LTS8_ORYPU
MEFKLIQAAFNGDLRRFKRLAKMLDMGRGRLGKFVREARLEGVPKLEGVGVMHAAAASGSLAMCTYLVETLQLDVNDVTDDGSTALFNAVELGNLDIIKYLLDHGANPDHAMICGLTPLHCAAGFGHCAIVKELLAKGAYVDPVSVYGTPLHIAALEGKDNTLKILLDHDADCNRVVNGKTPLLVAKRAASERCVELLVEAGADDSILTDFLGAAIIGSAERLNSMLEEIDTNHHVPDDEPLLAHMGDGGKALLDAHECRKKRPDWPKACYRQGTALMLLKDYLSACEALFDGLKLDPGNAEIEDALRYPLSHPVMLQLIIVTLCFTGNNF